MAVIMTGERTTPRALWMISIKASDCAAFKGNATTYIAHVWGEDEAPSLQQGAT